MQYRLQSNNINRMNAFWLQFFMKIKTLILYCWVKFFKSKIIQNWNFYNHFVIFFSTGKYCKIVIYFASVRNYVSKNIAFKFTFPSFLCNMLEWNVDCNHEVFFLFWIHNFNGAAGNWTLRQKAIYEWFINKFRIFPLVWVWTALSLKENDFNFFVKIIQRTMVY